ncbi:MAG: family 16 glycosylhydrolase [Clostridia bacterium]|nr:family 16 glycosylhydrolase [Clostridia bacterium]
MTFNQGVRSSNLRWITSNHLFCPIGQERFFFSKNRKHPFNTYGVSWNETEYVFYINGVETGRSSFGGTSRVPEYLLLTAEVGGANGVAAASWAGDALQSDAEPTDFVIDYVRAYQYRSLLG